MSTCYKIAKNTSDRVNSECETHTECLMVEEKQWHHTGALVVRYSILTFYCVVLYLAACTLKVQEVHYYCSVEMFTITLHPSAYFALLGKIDGLFCFQKCLFLLASSFAQNSASKFCPSLPSTAFIVCSFHSGWKCLQWISRVSSWFWKWSIFR